MPESNNPTHQKSTQQQTFAGFAEPTSNFFRMPTIWTNITAAINNLAELKVVEYILRHTWGYQEYGIKKHITVDEFVGGRKRQNGSRMDQGTGLSERAVRYGLGRALNDGLIVEEVDAADRGRVKKFYALKMRGQDGEEGNEDLRGEVQIVHPEVQDIPSSGAPSAPRSEKETLDRDFNLRSSKAHASERRNELKSGETRLREMPDDVKAIPALRDHHQQDGNGVSRRSQDFQRVGALLSRRTEVMQSGPRSASSSTRRLKPTPAITACIAEISQVFGDTRHLRSNVSQTMRLQEASGISESGLVARLYEAMAITRDQQRRGETTGSSQPVRHAMPYFFRVVRDLLGIAESEHDAQISPTTVIEAGPPLGAGMHTAAALEKPQEDRGEREHEQ